MTHNRMKNKILEVVYHRGGEDAREDPGRNDGTLSTTDCRPREKYKEGKDFHKIE